MKNFTIYTSGRAAGAVSDERWVQFQKMKSVLIETKNLLRSKNFSPQGWAKHGISVQFDGVYRRYTFSQFCFFFRILTTASAYHLLRYPGVTVAGLKRIIPDLADVDPNILSRLDIDGMQPFPHLL